MSIFDENLVKSKSPIDELKCDVIEICVRIMDQRSALYEKYHYGANTISSMDVENSMRASIHAKLAETFNRCNIESWNILVERRPCGPVKAYYSIYFWYTFIGDSRSNLLFNYLYDYSEHEHIR